MAKVGTVTVDCQLGPNARACLDALDLSMQACQEIPAEQAELRGELADRIYTAIDILTATLRAESKPKPVADRRRYIAEVMRPVAWGLVVIAPLSAVIALWVALWLSLLGVSP